MLERFGRSENMRDIAFLAHACVFGPQALGADGTRVRQLAEQRESFMDPPHHVSSIHVLGLAYYRVGLNDKTVECLEKCPTDEDTNVFNWLVLAMAHQRLRHAAEARQYLEKARQWIRLKTESMPAKGGGFAPPGNDWSNWLVLQMLHQEAETLIKQ